MKILTLADLHIGRKLFDVSLINDQKFVLKQALDLIKQEKIKAVLISGDVFDKAIPSVEAINLFSDFLEEINKLKTKIFIISGNHDNIERLSYLSAFLKKDGIYFSKNFNSSLESYSLNDEIDVYLMPYLYPAIIRKYYNDFEFNSYSQAIKKVIDETKINQNKFNILLAHQFVIKTNALNDDLVLSDSEQKSIGLVDSIDYRVFEKFDYVSLGHLHCPQKVVSEKIRYCGSILKYSLSEANQKKFFTILNIKNKKISLEFKDIEFLHDVKILKGKFEEFLDEKFYSKIKCDDFIHFILQNDGIIDAKKELSRIYPNILLLEFDNSLTRNFDSVKTDNFKKNKTLEQHFCDFYKIQTGCELTQYEKEIVEKFAQKTLNKEEKCAL